MVLQVKDSGSNGIDRHDPVISVEFKILDIILAIADGAFGESKELSFFGRPRWGFHRKNYSNDYKFVCMKIPMVMLQLWPMWGHKNCYRQQQGTTTRVILSRMIPMSENSCQVDDTLKGNISCSCKDGFFRLSMADVRITTNVRTGRTRGCGDEERAEICQDTPGSYNCICRTGWNDFPEHSAATITAKSN